MSFSSRPSLARAAATRRCARGDLVRRRRAAGAGLRFKGNVSPRPVPALDSIRRGRGDADTEQVCRHIAFAGYAGAIANSYGAPVLRDRRAMCPRAPRSVAPQVALR